MHKNIIYSFDVFDTCLTRIYSCPVDLFYDLANKFLSEYCRHGYDNDTRHFFVKLRIRAEREARNIVNETREDITLFNIYQQLQKISPWRFNIEEAMQLEMETELLSIRAVLPIKLKINELRKQGYRIIFISDMYLPTAFLKQCLLEDALAQSNDALYVSGDIGLTKHQGSLFHYVVEKEGLEYSNIIHCGDNLHSDVNIPKKMGIKTLHFKDVQLTRFDRALLNSKPYRLSEKINVSKLVAIGRIARLEHPNDSNIDKHLISLMSSVIAPLLTSFTAWVLRTAKYEGVERLYFISRDGQILFKIAQELKKTITAPECRYLYGSRQAWLLPSINHIDEDNIHWLTLPGYSTSIRDILGRLNLKPEDVEFLLIEHGFTDNSYDKQLAGNDLERFRQFLFQTPDVARMIMEKSNAARSLLAKYFEQENLNDGTPWAIVDIGWRLNCQQALKRIINSIDWKHQPKGYYFGLSDDHLPASEVGEYKAFLPKKQNQFSKRRSVIEHVFTPATHATINEYHMSDRSVEPVFKNTFYNSVHSNYLNMLHEICIDYALNTAQLGIWKDDHPIVDEAIYDNAAKILTYPTSEDVTAINWIPMNIDQLHDQNHNQSIAEKTSLRRLLDLVRYELGMSKSAPPGCYWLEGAAALSSPFMRTAIHTLIYANRTIQRLQY